MDLQSDRGRRVSVDELNTSRLLAHATQQAHQRKFDEMMIVDVDAHHYENEHIRDIIPFMENDVLRQLSMAQTMKGGRGNLMPVQVGYQDMGGRVTRYPLRTTEKTDQTGPQRDVALGHRWMDAMSVDYSCLFPTGMLNIGLHPQKEMEVDLCWAYNRWVTEKVLPESDGFFLSSGASEGRSMYSWSRRCIRNGTHAIPPSIQITGSLGKRSASPLVTQLVI